MDFTLPLAPLALQVAAVESLFFTSEDPPQPQQQPSKKRKSSPPEEADPGSAGVGGPAAKRTQGERRPKAGQTAQLGAAQQQHQNFWAGKGAGRGSEHTTTQHAQHTQHTQGQEQGEGQPASVDAGQGQQQGKGSSGRVKQGREQGRGSSGGGGKQSQQQGKGSSGGGGKPGSSAQRPGKQPRKPQWAEPSTLEQQASGHIRGMHQSSQSCT